MISNESRKYLKFRNGLMNLISLMHETNPSDQYNKKSIKMIVEPKDINAIASSELLHAIGGKIPLWLGHIIEITNTLNKKIQL